MGNCINHQRVASWGLDDDDEDWESEELVSFREYQEDEGEAGKVAGEKKELLGRKRGVPLNDRVKIKITKKQLKELLRRVDANGMTIQKLLADLMSMSDASLLERGQHWRPALQSIPEVSE